MFQRRPSYIAIISRIGHRFIWPSTTRIVSLKKGRLIMATQAPQNLAAGHSDNLSIAYLDQFGLPMLVTPTPDSPPAWSNAPNPAGDDVLTVNGPGNLTAALAANAAGTDSVTLSVTVGGVTFTAVQPINISPAPQVLTSVEIVNAVS